MWIFISKYNDLESRSGVLDDPMVTKSVIPYQITIDVEDKKLSIEVKNNFTIFKNEDVYMMPTVNQEENGEFLMEFNYVDGHLNIQDKVGLSLIPKDVNISQTSVNNITIQQNYTTCKLKGKKYLLFLISIIF